jgi:SMI1 / KNR4 family (SUKH-1)
MTIGDWQAFYDTLDVSLETACSWPAPTLANLDAFEIQTGVKLPLSYRDFILVFGPGEFSSALRIAAPGYAHTGTTFDLTIVSQSYRYNPFDLSRSGLSPDDRHRVQNLLYFGLAHGEEWLGWDTRDLRIPTENEYAIYRVDWRRDSISFVTNSFRDLVAAFCDDLFAPDPDYDEDAMGPQRSFRRVTRPS